MDFVHTYYCIYRKPRWYAGVVGRLRKVELSLIIQGQSWERHRTLYTTVIWSESTLIHTDIHTLSSSLFAVLLYYKQL